jgi:hypothetical protein
MTDWQTRVIKLFTGIKVLTAQNTVLSPSVYISNYLTQLYQSYCSETLFGKAYLLLEAEAFLRS